MDYCEFFETEEQAIEHCRVVNAGLRPDDPGCCAVVDGPGCADAEHAVGCQCAAYAVVDIETARELLAFGEAGALPCLIVTG